MAARFRRRTITPMDDHRFRSWFDGSVVQEDGTPIVVWRGEHGPVGTGRFATRHGSLSFGTRETACLYAISPNERYNDPVAVAPRVSPFYLRIARPVMNDADDPFIDMAHLIRALGRDAARAVALRLSSHITRTGQWEEDFAGEWGADLDGLLRARPSVLDDLYGVAHPFLDDPDLCRLLAAAGYDGAVCGGWGDNACEPEWRLIDHDAAVSALCWRSDLPRPMRIAA
jgi:hypothetical protein